MSEGIRKDGRIHNELAVVSKLLERKHLSLMNGRKLIKGVADRIKEKQKRQEPPPLWLHLSSRSNPLH